MIGSQAICGPGELFRYRLGRQSKRGAGCADSGLQRQRYYQPDLAGHAGRVLNVRNTVLPSLQGDSQQQGALNILAQQVADRVNQILTSGTTAGGAPGTALVYLQQRQPGGCCGDAGAESRDHRRRLAPANGSGGNGAALQLSNLGDSTAPGDEINGQTIVQYAASMASQVGQQASDAQTGQTLHTPIARAGAGRANPDLGRVSECRSRAGHAATAGYDAAGKMVSVIGRSPTRSSTWSRPVA